MSSYALYCDTMGIWGQKRHEKLWVNSDVFVCHIANGSIGIS